MSEENRNSDDRPRFEYSVTDVKSSLGLGSEALRENLDLELDRLGAEGWEVFQVSEQRGIFRIFARRSAGSDESDEGGEKT